VRGQLDASLPIKVTQPDGSWLSHTYDGAHRLTDVSDNLGNTVHYTLNDIGNRKQEDYKDPAGALAKSIKRVYDPLNRLQNLTVSRNEPAAELDARSPARRATRLVVRSPVRYRPRPSPRHPRRNAENNLIATKSSA
jgi:YD repeat-containing protein